LNELFQNLIDEIEKINNESSNNIREKVKKSIDDLKTMKQQSKDNDDMRDAYTYFLPLPDKNKRDELIGILPHIASFTNLHARLNSLHSHDLSSVTIIHDNHAHFDEIIEDYHKTAIDDTSDKNRVYEMADFNFTTISNLEFHDDKNKIGLQVADIFAGLINRAIPYIIKKEISLTEHEYAILLQILTSLYFQKSINFVLPLNHHLEDIFPVLDKQLHWIMTMAYRGIDKEEIDNFLLEKK